MGDDFPVDHGDTISKCGMRNSELFRNSEFGVRKYFGVQGCPSLLNTEMARAPGGHSGAPRACKGKQAPAICEGGWERKGSGDRVVPDCVGTTRLPICSERFSYPAFRTTS